MGILGWFADNKNYIDYFTYARYCISAFLLSYCIAFFIPNIPEEPQASTSQTVPAKFDAQQAANTVGFLIETLGDQLFAIMIAQKATKFSESKKIEEFPFTPLILLRLQFLELLVKILTKKKFNREDVRQWFQAKQSDLYNNSSPEEVLSQNWHPDDPAACRVREVAHLVASKSRWR